MKGRIRIWDRISSVFAIGLFADERGAGEISRRWNREQRRDPALMADLINMGGLMQQAETKDFTPEMRLAYEAGRRDLALQLSAMAGLTIAELNSLIGDTDD